MDMISGLRYQAEKLKKEAEEAAKAAKEFQEKQQSQGGGAALGDDGSDAGSGKGDLQLPQ